MLHSRSFNHSGRQIRRRQQHLCDLQHSSKRLHVSCSSAARTDVLALGNLCVDVVVKLPELPPADPASRKQLLSALTQQTSAADTSNWEVGGNCNFIIAAARLGLQVSTIGHAGSDDFGAFMDDILRQESVVALERITTHGEVSVLQGKHESPQALKEVDQTLVCFVLVDPNSRHAFCSRYDFGPWPLLGGLSQLPQPALKALESTRAVFMNGFVFDELPLEVVRHACNHAIQNGAAVFFDPGPRCFTMMEGPRQAALDEIISLSEVVLMTEEEAVTVTGHHDPEAAARQILARPGTRTQWCVVKLGAAGALLVNKKTDKAYSVPGFQVKVKDTVGCGDSFAAAIVLGYINGCSEEAALTLANAVGAATATGRGAGRNVAKASKVTELLEAACNNTSSKASIQGALQMLSQTLATAAS